MSDTAHPRPWNTPGSLERVILTCTSDICPMWPRLLETHSGRRFCLTGQGIWGHQVSVSFVDTSSTLSRIYWDIIRRFFNTYLLPQLYFHSREHKWNRHLQLHVRNCKLNTTPSGISHFKISIDHFYGRHASHCPLYKLYGAWTLFCDRICNILLRL